MKGKAIRTLLVLCVILDIALMGLVLYDYYKNDAQWITWLLAVFALFVLITAILFALAGGKPKGEPEVIVKEVRVEVPVERPVEVVQERTGFVPIPPVPLRTGAEPAPRLRAPEPSGPFTYKGYTLHTREVDLANKGGHRRIYFFSKRKPKSGKPCAKPHGYHVGVNERTGLPFLKKGAGKDGEDLTPSAPEPGYRPQCSALTEEGVQCRNSAREGSKYCASHFGYQPPVLSKAEVNQDDTKAAVAKAPDTKPSTRKSWFGRRKANAS